MGDNGSMKHLRGFTLAELLIALAILGVIAVFAIPKVLQSQQNTEWNAVAKEATSMISGAYKAYEGENSLSGSTTAGALTPYMNYVSLHTGQIDAEQGYGSSINCATLSNCLKLHNGSVLAWPIASFSGTASTNAVYYYLDPDGVYSGSATGNGKSVVLFLYYNGRLTDYGSITPGTATSSYTYPSACPSCMPPWFSWD